jgi:phage FluMu protein Com
MWKCSVCGYIHVGAEAPEKCPKCGAAREKFIKLTDEEEALIKKSERTNDLHMIFCHLMDKVVKVCEEGIELDLDPGCVATFKKGKEQCEVLKNISKAEIATHMKKNKW